MIRDSTLLWFALTVAAVFTVLTSSEVWWRRRAVHGELSRKFVHITVGSFVALWPFFLSWNDIRLLSAAFLIVISISKYFKIFQAIHSVQRPTWGEIFFALAVGGVSLVSQNKWIYLTAILQMSLADGLAAVIGVRYGERHAYKVFGHTKTVIGSSAFWLVSVALLLLYIYGGGGHLPLAAVPLLAGLATAVENCGIAGLDNLLVPLLIALCLRFIQ